LISIIIPTLNEAGKLPGLLAALRNEPAESEIVIVDGGSCDGTVEIALSHGLCVLQASRGRGNQLCAGAGRARGDILLFLHADSIFPAGGLQRIDETLSADPGLIGGNFRLVFDGGSGFSRWLTGFYTQIRWLGFYYGDSGIFVRRRVYDALGGFRPMAVMEDWDFVRRLERFGRTCCIAEPALITSSRRFEGRQPAEIIYGWVKLHFLYWLGVSPDRLAEIYKTHAPPAEVTRISS
jgi:rSAM/selenodomain-associated transferase 2